MYQNLKGVLEYIKGKKPILIEYTDENSLPYLSAEYLRNNKIESYVDKNTIDKKYHCNKDDLLIIWDGSNSGEVFMGKTGILSSTMVKLKIKDNKYLNKYVYYFLKQNFGILNEKVTGAAIPHLNRSVLENLSIYSTDKSEQEEIVKVLDTMSDIICLREECIEHAQKLIPALFQEMFGEPLERTGSLKIGQFYNVGTGATPRRENSSYYEGINPWVKTTEVNNCYIEQTEEHISDEAISKTNCTLYEQGTILLAMYGQGKTRGKVAYLNILATTNQACAALQLKKEYTKDINNKFVFYYLQIIYNYLRTLSQGGGRPNMNLSIVRNIPLFKPDVELQNKFVDKVIEIEAYIKEQKKELENANQMFQSLLHHAFTGELTRRAYGKD